MHAKAEYFRSEVNVFDTAALDVGHFSGQTVNDHNFIDIALFLKLGRQAERIRAKLRGGKAEIRRRYPIHHHMRISVYEPSAARMKRRHRIQGFVKESQ